MTSMMRPRLLAFVSSRMEELAPERRVVKGELDKLHVDAWVFEQDAGARPQTIQQTYLQQVETADLYIGIFWQGYGPYTLEEYERARALGKSCLVYEKRTELERRDPELAEFLKELGQVETGLTVRRFETPEQLGQFVKDDVAAWQVERIRAIGTLGYAAPFQAPALGDQYVERRSLMTQLRAQLLARDSSGLPIVTRAALHGIGGLGKSLMASAFAASDVVRTRFPDGVLWVTLGQSPDITQRLSDWGRALRDPSLTTVGYADEDAGTNQLRALLSDKACLLVVDDVWVPGHATPFLVGGRRCLLLVTTRIAEVAQEIGATAFELTEMTPDEARTLVEKWSGTIASADRADAEWLLNEVRYLPLALELIGARAKSLGWQTYRRRWESQKLKAVKRGRLAQGKQNNLWDSFELSLSALPDDDRARYVSLSVFHEDTPFPARACAALWGCGEDEATELLADLNGQALLRERPELTPRRYVFHDLLHDFVVEEIGADGRKQATTAMIDGYRALCGGNWSTSVDDGYFFEHLSEHLASAGVADELYTVIDRQWMDAQFRRTQSHRAFASDLSIVLAAASAETPPNVLQIVRATYLRATLGTVASSSEPETLGALAGIGHVDTAYGYAELIQEPVKRSRAYGLIAQSLLARNSAREARAALNGALEAAQAVDEGHLRCRALCDLVGTLVQADESELAAAAAAEAEAAARDEANDYFKRDLLVRAVGAQAVAGNITAAKALALEAEKALDDHDESHNLALLVRLEAALTRAGLVDRAGEIESKFTALLNEVNSKIRGDEYVFLGYAAELSEAFLDAGAVDDAIIIAERWIGRSWAGAGALASGACSLADAGDVERAKAVANQAADIVRELLSDKQYKFDKEHLASFARVADALARVGREKEAIALGDAAQVAEAKQRALAVVALMLARSNRTDEALRVANDSLAASHRLTDDATKTISWQAASAKALFHAGKKPEAVERAAHAMRLAEHLTGSGWEKTNAIGELASVLAATGDWTNAMQLIGRLADAATRTQALLAVIRSSNGDPDRARALANMTIETTETLSAPITVEALGAAANALVEAGLREEAVELGRRATAAAGQIRDPNDDCADGLLEVARAFAGAGRFDEARSVTDAIDTKRMNGNLARTVSRKVRALGALVDALERAGRHELAIAAARNALDATRDAVGDGRDLFTHTSDALNAAAQALKLVGDLDGATRANRAALELAQHRLRNPLGVNE